MFPRKDGILAGLLCCETEAPRQNVTSQLRELFAKVGSLYLKTDNFPLTEEVKAKFTEN